MTKLLTQFSFAQRDHRRAHLWATAGGVLCLLGGGYRAALFHLGALTRLNELGLLARTETVGAVAGGSILAALLAARIPWPLHGAYREWHESVAEPMREIAQRNRRARTLLRHPISGSAAEAALEERYARELAGAVEARTGEQPRFVFGGAGLALGKIAGGEDDASCLRWKIGDSTATGYDPVLVAKVIARVGADLGACGEVERAVLENHGYTLVDAALQSGRAEGGGLNEPRTPKPPHPQWMDPARVDEALEASSRWKRRGRLRSRWAHFAR